jgi:hypothetical protein
MSHIGHGLDDLGIGVRFQMGARDFIFSVQTGSEASPASYSVGTVGSFLEFQEVGA